jgi:O-methyltransferase domain
MIDIGTAQGCLPVQIAQIHSHIWGGGFDLPSMQPLFERYVREHRLDDCLRFYAGNFLQDPLPSADVLVLGRVLHNWDLQTKKMLLRKVYDALPEGGSVIVFERLIDDERKRGLGGLLSSLHMLLMTEGGFDFTAADCASWMLEAGFHDPTIVSLTSTHSMVAATK